MTGTPPPFRRPQHGPPSSAARDIAEWDALVAGSIDRATATAEKWRTGLAGFVTIVTSVLLLKGPDAQKLAHPWHALVIGLFVLAVVLLVAGLWQALSASAPQSHSRDYASVIGAYGSVRAYSITVANTINDALDRAKVFVLVALIAFASGIAAWWLVPQVSEKARATLVSVAMPTGNATCGALVDSKDGAMMVQPDGGPAVSILLRDTKSVAVVERCGAKN
ncbi:hypothetical protein ACFRAQ_10915 [Nocardia sp. NPDC056611]|uniref:hypothetical protein n=1 Tax=Nocardia sp. NPDC056611 TaxID=3345877 RepID=UPI00366E9C6E